MAYSQSDYESDLRYRIGDLGYGYEESRIVEDLTDQVIGGAGNRISFSLSHTNIYTSGVYINVNETGFVNTGFTIDPTNGFVIFVSGTQPTISNTYAYPTKFETLYYFQHFQQADLDNFINYGLDRIGFSPMTGDNSTTAYQGLNTGFYNVVQLYAMSQAYLRLASKYARMPNVSAQGKSSGKSVISQRYSDLAKESLDMAEAERLAVNGPRQGRSTVGSLVIQHQAGQGLRWNQNRRSY